MQRGGSSADVWVMTDVKNGAQVDPTTLLQSGLSASSITQRKRLVTSRAAENLFWLGRYSERAENTVRLAELTLECLHGEHQSTQPLLLWLSQMAAAHGLVLPAVPPASQARRVFERSLIAGLGEPAMASSVGFNLRAIKSSAFAVRERLSPAQWQMIVLAEQEFSRRCAAQAEAGDYSSIEALRTLAGASAHLAAITGAQTDRMTRDDGWRLLSIGRHVERLGFLADALASGLETGAVHTEGGFDAVIALIDSTITFRSLFQQSHELAALLDLLVVDRDNPRSLGWVVQTLRGRLAKLGGFAPGVIDGLSLQLPDPSQWDLVQLCEPHSGALAHPLPSASSDAMPETKGGPPGYPALAALLQHCRATAYRISDQIGATYFTHSAPARQTGGPV
jgi:uncharacterized alpha-E superfamily protein